MKRNVKTAKKLNTNTWRKIALTAWNTPNEPVIYSRVQLNPKRAIEYLETLNQNRKYKITITHYIGKVCGILLYKHPELNSSILFNNAYVRHGSDVFFHVSLIDKNGNENLSGFKVTDCAKKNIIEIATELNHAATEIKTGNDVTFNKIKSIMRFIPLFISKWIIRLTTLIQYRLNIWTPLLGTKQDTFGSMMLTNIGSLGIDEAFVPFSSYTNVTSICAIGRLIAAPIIENGAVVPGFIQYACWTLDHRVIDGSSAAKMQETFRSHFENPDLIEQFDSDIKKI